MKSQDIGDAGPTYNEKSDLNNKDVWIGQEVTLELDGDYTSLQIRQGSTYSEDDDVVLENRVRNQEVTFDSSELEAGNPYNLNVTGDNGDSKWNGVVFWVESEDLNTEFTSSTVSQEGSVNVSLESDRDTQWLNVSADGLDTDDLDNIFSNSDSNIEDVTTHEDDDRVTLNVTGVPSDDSVEFGADFSEIDAGEYEFDFESTDSLAADNATVEVIQDDAEVNFEGDANGEQGEIIDITVSTQYVDSGAVQIADLEDQNFQAATEFEIDEDDLNEITLQFNTNAPNATGADDAWSLHPKHDDHDIELSNKAVNASELDEFEPLGAYEYEMEAGTDLNTSSDLHEDNYYIDDSDVTDTAFFNVNDPTPVGDVSTHVAPAGDNVEGFDNLNDTTVTESNVVADGDHLLLNLDSFDQSGLVDSWSNGESVGEDLGNQSINITVEEQDPGPNVDANVWSTNPDQVADSDADDLIHANVTYTDVSEYDGNLVLALNYEDAGLEADESYDLTYSVSEDSPYVDSEDEEVEIEDSFTIEEPELEWDDSAEEVPNSANADVTGETNVAPGSEIDTNARSSGNFTDSEDAIVAEDGTFTATYDFSEYDAGITFDLTATHADRNEFDSNYEDDLRHQIESTLVDAEEPLIQLDTSAPEEVTVGDDATLDVTVANNGGAADEVEIGVDIAGESVDSQTVTLEPGDEWSQSYSFDTSEAGDIEWGVTAGDDSASGTLSVVEEEEPADDSGTDDSGTDDSGSDDSGSDDSGSDDSGSDDSGSDDGGASGTPGFGVAVAAIALLAAAMLALRRQD
ncbi:BGTF surface domain-containing protein [Halopiger aswanensis]|uniref:BGTF surface domain-containing protein n=1 Tax=Halopiger aswanensis TaxID=148449 RepID=UPI001FE679AA|nr:BGTF surface domain-containing protein [Halopiger aswanensis]